MRPRHLALAAMMILGCGGGATASPPKPSLPVMSLSHRVTSTRSDGATVTGETSEGPNGIWGANGRSKAPVALTPTALADSFVSLPEAARPAPRRRGSWVDPPPLH